MCEGMEETQHYQKNLFPIGVTINVNICHYHKLLISSPHCCHYNNVTGKIWMKI